MKGIQANLLRYSIFVFAFLLTVARVLWLSARRWQFDTAFPNLKKPNRSQRLESTTENQIVRNGGDRKCQMLSWKILTTYHLQAR